MQDLVKVTQDVIGNEEVQTVKCKRTMENIRDKKRLFKLDKKPDK